MAAGKIKQYQAAWQPDQNRGVIVLHLERGEKKKWQVETATEFLAILKVLEDNDPLLTDNGWISTGREVPGGLVELDT